MNGSCGAHAGLGAELRGTALLLLDRVRAAVEPIQAGGADSRGPEPGSAGACQACPVCAVVAVLRGEHSELAGRLAEHAAGLVAVLAAVLEADAPRPGAAGRPPPEQPDAGSGTEEWPAYQPRVPGAHGRSVQRIAVHRR